jgi:hypothetical protein
VPTPAQAARDALFRYEPPSVETIYPAEGDVLLPAPLPAQVAPEAPEAPVAPAPEPEQVYGAQASVRAATPGAREVPLQSARDLPGAFGDPLRILDALPGTTPIANAVPYVYLRGAPPAAINYVYDDIPLPQLFHGVFGPAVVHPRLIGPIKLHAGVPPARYGRRAGGLVLAEGVPPAHAFDAEVEVRLIDAGAWLEAPLGPGEITVSGRIGYPKLAFLVAEGVGALEPGSKFNYWDGQLRYRLPIGSRDRLELIWLGSFDSAYLPGLSNNPRAGASTIEFHRVETRFVHHIDRGEVGAALRFGYDNSTLGEALEVRAVTVGPRFWTKLRLGPHALRIGGDLYSTTGDVVDGTGALATPEGDIEVTLPDIGEAPGRNQGGIYAQATLMTSERTNLELGARLDYWSTQSQIELAVDPRVRFAYRPIEPLELHAAFGLAHQPAVFMLPLPGLADIAVSDGLTRSVQSELGASYDLPLSLRLEVQGFVHYYDGILLPELVTDGAVPEDPPLVSALSYGVELFLKRELGESVSGWISYTLGWAEADSGPEVIGKFKPDFDVRHVLNTVVQWRIWRGLQLGGRFGARSGRLIEQLNPAYAQRLPWFVRLDMRLGYAWRGRFADMLAYVEWLNMLVRKEYLDADCLLGQCRASAAPVLSIPNLGVRAEF